MQARDHEGVHVGVEIDPQHAAEERRAGAAELVTARDPAVHHRGLLAAEALADQLHGRRDGGDPVEAVEDREQRQRVEGVERERQEQERQPAQPVIDAEQDAAVDAVAEIARAGGADEVEDRHRGEQARRHDFRDAVVDAGRNEVRADQPVGRGAADEERAGEQIEVAVAQAEAQRAERVADRIAGRALAAASPRRSRHRRAGRCPRGGCASAAPPAGSGTEWRWPARRPWCASRRSPR